MAQQVYYDQRTGQYVDQGGQPIGYDPSAKPKSAPIWSPDLAGAYNQSSGALQNYFNALERPDAPPDYTKSLEEVGPYQGFNWTNPEEYYNAPDNYQAGQFSDVPDLMATSKGQYDAQRAAQRENIANQFGDVRSQLEEELARSGRRPEQAAALLASLGVQQVQKTQGSMREIDFQQMQNEQQLLKDQYGLNFQKEGAQMGENQYAYQQSLDDARFRAGLQQYYQEQQAAEEQSKYQSAYGLAQDTASLGLQQYDVGRAADYDYYNALLQGQQAATQQFSQAGTYTTNLTEKERGKLREQQGERGYNPYNYQTPTQQPSASAARPRTATQGGGRYA